VLEFFAVICNLRFLFNFVHSTKKNPLTHFALACVLSQGMLTEYDCDIISQSGNKNVFVKADRSHLKKKK
jgi:hypothetical protein